MSAVDWTQKVFRLRKLPNHITRRHEVRQLLGGLLRIRPDDIIVYSIARTSNRWEELPSKVATLQFKSLPNRLRQDSKRQEWELALSETSSDKLVLDTHFRGLTVLNDVRPSEHKFDCIAISGLASHPFGSWQPHASDKSYMWIRDEIPNALPGVRALTYGYDSMLDGSDSFQTIGDIALGLVHHLKSGGWNLLSSKPIIFLAHSLGGLVLKQALVYLAEGDASISSVLGNLRGGIMFGVPSLGMHQSHLRAIVQGRPNDTLVQDLSRENGSAYLRQLNSTFEGISFTRTVPIFWAYETKESPTVIVSDENIPFQTHATKTDPYFLKTRPDGSRDPNGPLAVLVNPDSATNHRNHDPKRKAFTVSINETHTNMVKFSRGDSNLGTIISLLTDLCDSRHDFLEIASSTNLERHSRTVSRKANLSHAAPVEPSKSQNITVLEDFHRLFTFVQEQHDKIYLPELDFRVDQIDDPFHDTFKWIFELPLFCEWLQHGSGLFWVHGKPGSGKSTLMKFVFRSALTWELLHDWKRSSHEIIAGFFFHYRGSAMQKSFEGVLRSLVVQILLPHYKAFEVQHSAIWGKYGSHRDQEIQLRIEQKRNSVRLSNPHASILEHGQGVQDSILLPTDQQPLDAHAIKRLQERQKDIDQELCDIEQATESILPHIIQQIPACLELPETRFLLEIMRAFHEDDNELIIKLEKTLRRLLDQTAISMDLILFFDALDEFDGHLDMISRFLKSLVDVLPTSKTRVKVCLSSRPWEQLHAHFSSYHNLALQDYTRADIEEYAALSMAALHIANPSIVKVVPILMAKANGVFLWVKLAVQELSNAISSSAQVMSRQELEETLWKLPDDLQDFYGLIIERISRSCRRQTYALLELLVRQIDPPTQATYIREAVLVSGCTTFREAEEVLRDNSRTPLTPKRVKNNLTTWSGGLVELHGNHAEFMHQTTQEYFMRLSFKRSVLGSLEPFVTENGHSFYFKYWLSVFGYKYHFTNKELLMDLIAYHGVKSEFTTGNSHIGFISSISSKGFQLLPTFDPSLTERSNALLTFIVSNRLSLCLQDWIAARPDQLRILTSSPHGYYPLLSALIVDLPDTGSYDGCLATARLLLENGYNMQHDPKFLTSLLQMACRSSSGVLLSILRQLVTLVLQHGQDPNVSIKGSAKSGATQHTALHIAPPDISTILIEGGAHVNARDSAGTTPLDWLLAFPDKLTACSNAKWDVASKYEKCMVLVPAGGILTEQGLKADWKVTLEDFEEKGHDTRALHELLDAQAEGTWMSSLSRIFGFTE